MRARARRVGVSAFDASSEVDARERVRAYFWQFCRRSSQLDKNDASIARRLSGGLGPFPTL